MKNVSIAVAIALSLAACGEPRANDPKAELEITKKSPITKAEDVVMLLEKDNIPISDIKIVTEGDDANQLLGRPSQYTSKLFFYDSRHPRIEASDEHENTIEVFATADDAKTRHDYIESVTKGVPLLLQYMILQDNVLVRLDKSLLPSEAEAYKNSLKKI